MQMYYTVVVFIIIAENNYKSKKKIKENVLNTKYVLKNYSFSPLCIIIIVVHIVLTNNCYFLNVKISEVPIVNYSSILKLSFNKTP